MSREDRTVHATLCDGSQIVRYDRAGKWYREWPGMTHRSRRPLTVTDAAQLAADLSAFWYSDRPGGSAFDAKVRRLRSSAATS